MEKKKGILASVFSHKGKDRELTVALKEDFGITLTEENCSLEEIQKRGYHRFERNTAAQFDSIFQYIPQIVMGQVNQGNVGKAFNAAVKGTFRCQLAPGTHLASSKSLLGAFRGTGLSNQTNQVAAQANWIPNNATLNVSAAPMVALGIFNAMSIVTGQYFMAQINRKMSDL